MFKETPGIMICNLQTFWLNFNDGGITLGQGVYIGSQPVLDYHDDIPIEVSAITVQSDGATWTFGSSIGQYLSFRAAINYSP